jgi:hypothetical protein
MKKHGRDDLLRFVRALDAQLPEPVTLIVIGGAAASLHHGARRPTSDIDTFQKTTSLPIPVSFAGRSQPAGYHRPSQTVG